MLVVLISNEYSVQYCEMLWVLAPIDVQCIHARFMVSKAEAYLSLSMFACRACRRSLLGLSRRFRRDEVISCVVIIKFTLWKYLSRKCRHCARFYAWRDNNSLK